MPTEERGNIGQVKPTGWHTVKYDCVDGKYLYNRCHLIGYQLTGENANTKNLITGTRYMNVDGMLPFENMVADYIRETNNHVMYRVTPIYENNNLLANGVLMEAYSVEDKGEDLCFCVYVYNVQPGVTIDYKTGESSLTDNQTQAPTTTEATTKATTVKTTETQEETTIVKIGRYILNINTKKFHYSDCSSVKQMSEKNKEEYEGSREELIEDGYEPCKRCNP
jgi:DNA-entry nuclease